MTSPLHCGPSKSSTPCRPAITFENLNNQSKFTDDDRSPAAGTKSVSNRKSLRHSLGHISLHGMTPKRMTWLSQRTSRLFELLTKPVILFTPSYGIRLPFGSDPDLSLVSRPVSHMVSTVPLPIQKRNLPMDPDPCLISMDGMLDCFYAISHLVDAVYYDCKESERERLSVDPYDRSPTLMLTKFVRKRLKIAITRLNDLRIQLSDFSLGKFIGRGACGVVRVVQEVAPPRTVYAMKSQFKGAWLHHDPEGTQLMLERTVLAQAAAIENPWLPHLHYAFQDEKHLHLVMDYESGGDLYIFLNKVGHLLDADMIAFYVAEAVEAVHSLHRMGYIHCDLKPENFAIERSGHLKLLDFGSAIRLDADGKCICPTMVGTKEYLNIELLSQRERRNREPLLVGPEYDYWAIGVLLYEMFYSRTPFYDDDDDVMTQKIVDFKRTLKFPMTVAIPDDAIDLIRSLIIAPSKRLNYEGVVRHPFFRNVDFTTLRQTTPPYLPPVGEMDDVSNFSGGGARTRDEAIMDVSTNQTFSPVRMKESCSASLYGSATEASPLSANDATIRPQYGDSPHTDENTDPCAKFAEPVKEQLTERKLKEKAIREAAAMPIQEVVEEIEDIEWEGSECVRNLPFMGYTFTPGLVLLRKLTSGQTAATLAAGLGTTTLNPSFAGISCLSWCKPQLGNSMKPTDVAVPDTSAALEELTALQKTLTSLTNQLTLLKPEHLDQLHKLQQEIAENVQKLSDPTECVKSVDSVLTSIRSKERRILELVINQLDQLRSENAQLRQEATAINQYRSTLDKFQLTLSRLTALPGDFSEADLLDLVRTMWSSNDRQSDADRMVEQLINIILNQVRQRLAMEASSRQAVATANREMKEAWEASKQQMGTLDSIIADQRQLRDCENRLNREIQDLTEKLIVSRDYQRELRNNCMQCEDKYTTVCAQLADEQKRSSSFELQLREMMMRKEVLEAQLHELCLKYERLEASQSNATIIEQLKAELEEATIRLRMTDLERENTAQRELTLREKVIDLEHSLGSSRHEVGYLRDRQSRLEQAMSEMESMLLNRDEHSAMTSLHRQLRASSEEASKLRDEVSYLQAQVERLRLNNLKLVEHKDDAFKQLRELNATLEQEKELSEVTQQDYEREIFRLRTTTEQQGKLIRHMHGLLPPEHRPTQSQLTARNELVHQFSEMFHTKKSTTKHCQRAEAKSDEPNSSSSLQGGGGGPFVTAASTFFGRRRGMNTLGKTGQTLETCHTFVKQPSRLQRIVNKSRIRFKRRTVISPRLPGAHTQSDQVFTEDEDNDDGTLGYCSSHMFDDFDDDDVLPIQVPESEMPLDVDQLSTEDSLSSGPSTTSSAPSSNAQHCSLSWARQKSKSRVGWTKDQSKSSQPRFIKQLSKVLGKAKPLSSQTENNLHQGP